MLLTLPSKDDDPDVFLPMGNELIICGVYDPSNVIGDPVPSVESLVCSLSANNETLAGIPVVIKPFSLPPPMTSCYLCLHSQFDVTETEGVDVEPRCDLLHEWMVVLQSAQPQWEIQWAPQRQAETKGHGSDSPISLLEVWV
jgi:hypothetical protein